MSEQLERRPPDELEQVAQQVDAEPQLVLPVTGEIVDLREPGQVARALDDVRDLVRKLGELRALLETVLRLEARRQGTKTLHLGAVKAEVTGGERPEWDVPALVDGLRAAGLPEERLRELVTATVAYKVNARVATSVAASNPAYAEVIANARSTVPAPWRVTVKPA
jgi:hypothetical protein